MVRGRASSFAQLAMWMLILATATIMPVLAVQTNVSSLCSPSATVPLVRKGDPTYICINVNDGFRAVFTPVADRFTVLRVTNSWNDSRIGANPAGAFLTVSSLERRTNYKLYSSASKGRISPFLTAIVSVKQGVVQGVSWDDGCFFCDAAQCEPNLYSQAVESPAGRLEGEGFTCYSPVEYCGSVGNASALDALAVNASAKCDITLYVGWTGTDANGVYLGSAALRMSEFTKYSLGSFVDRVVASFSKIVSSSRDDEYV